MLLPCVKTHWYFPSAQYWATIIILFLVGTVLLLFFPPLPLPRVRAVLVRAVVDGVPSVFWPWLSAR